MRNIVKKVSGILDLLAFIVEAHILIIGGNICAP